MAYPEFLKQAWADEDKLSIWYFTKARNAEERHAHLYKLAISDMASNKEHSTSSAPTAGGSRPWRGPKNARTAAGRPGFYSEIQ